MSTALHRTSLGELSYSSLSTTSLGELSIAVLDDLFFGAGDDQGQVEDELIFSIIKAFIKRVS